MKHGRHCGSSMLLGALIDKIHVRWQLLPRMAHGV